MILTSIHHSPVRTHAFSYSLFHPFVLFSFLFCFLATSRSVPARDRKWLIYRLISSPFSSVFLGLILFSLLLHVFPSIFLLLISFTLFSLLRLSDTHIKLLYFLLHVQFASLIRLTLYCIFAFKARIFRIWCQALSRSVRVSYCLTWLIFNSSVILVFVC